MLACAVLGERFDRDWLDWEWENVRVFGSYGGSYQKTSDV